MRLVIYELKIYLIWLTIVNLDGDSNRSPSVSSVTMNWMNKEKGWNQEKERRIQRMVRNKEMGKN